MANVSVVIVSVALTVEPLVAINSWLLVMLAPVILDASAVML